MINFLASGKTKEARAILKSISPSNFDQFFKTDLKTLCKKSSPNNIVAFAGNKDSSVYQYAKKLDDDNNMEQFKKAITAQASSKGTKRAGLFYTLIFANEDNLFDQTKRVQMKSKIKTFLLATTQKDKDNNEDNPENSTAKKADQDIQDEDKNRKRMHNSNIIQKLNSSRVSNVLKVFMALVAWAYIQAAETEEADRKAAEEEAARKAKEEADRKAAEEEAARKAKEEADRKAAEEEAALKAAEEEAVRKAAEEEAARKAAEEEAARKSAEEEAARKAAEEKQQRINQQEQGITSIKSFLESQGYYSKFKGFIDSKINTEKIENDRNEQLIKITFKEDINKIISAFLKTNSELAKNFAETAYDAASKNFIQKLLTPYDQYEKISTIFNICKDDKPVTSIVKQLEQRYKQRIEKQIFFEEQLEIVKIGVFFLVIARHFAKQEKSKTSQNAEKTKPEESSTKKAEIDSVFHNPSVMSQYMTSGNYMMGAYIEKSDSLLGGTKDNNWLLLRSYYSQTPKFDQASPQELEQFSAWAETNTSSLNKLPQFMKETQEGAHDVLVTHDNDNFDPFVRFVFNNTHVGAASNSMLAYPYFFKGSSKKDLIINGKKIGLTGYTFPENLKLGETPSNQDLDTKLKEIWFRDVTKENKPYKKMSMVELHKTAESYGWLLNVKLAKYVLVTYKCEQNRILVSFKTNHFDHPTKLLNEQEFKTLFQTSKGRVLYRGMKEYESLKTLREKRVSSIVNKHRKRLLGAGIYWTTSYEEALEYASGAGGFIVMGIAVGDIPKITEEDVKMTELMNYYLMRDNQDILIREKAARSDFRGFVGAAGAKELEKDNIVVCKTRQQFADWANCK